MIEPGERTARLHFESPGDGTDNEFGEESGDWMPFAKAWARVLHGTGLERRDAAQKSASQIATFRLPATVRTSAVTTQFRFRFDGSVWDISSAIRIGDEVEITATRKSK